MDLRWQEKLAELKHIQQLRHHIEAIIYRSLCDRREDSRGKEKLDLKFHLEMSHVFMSNWFQSEWKEGRQKVIISQYHNCTMHYRGSWTKKHISKIDKNIASDIPYSAKFDNDENSLRQQNLPQLSCWLLTISFRSRELFYTLLMALREMQSRH